MRVGLIGPLPPSLGGATPGGVASHQAHLAAGLAAADGIGMSLLATNVHADSPQAWCAPAPPRQFGFLRMYAPNSAKSFLRLPYVRRVGLERIVRYGQAVRSMAHDGSRREVLEQLLWYAYYLRTTRPEIIHVQHPLERHRNVRLVQALEGRHVPVVVTAHSFFGEHPHSLIHELMAPNIRAADAVIAVSPHIAEQAVQLGADPARVRVIRSGVDAERFRPRDKAAARRCLRIARDVQLVLFVGNLEPRKQVDVLLRALPADATLAIVGTGESAGSEDQTDTLRSLVGELGHGNRVRFVGRVSDFELLDWYAAADVFALPSRSEAQGIVALEAMACGLPVVASAVGGLLGTIEDGQTGYLVPAGEVDALNDRLHRILDDPQLAARLGVAARAVVEARFTWSSAVAATIDVYREVLGG